MKFYTPVPVRFSDFDALGHINNATYFNYVEDARIHYFDEAVGRKNDWDKFGVLLAHNEIDYKIPVLPEHKLKCGIKTTKIGSKSIRADFEFIITTPEGESLTAATGAFVLVCFDHEKQSTALVPEEWRRNMKSFEGI